MDRPSHLEVLLKRDSFPILSSVSASLPASFAATVCGDLPPRNDSRAAIRRSIQEISGPYVVAASRLNDLPIATARTSQTRIRPTFTSANCRGAKPNHVVPANTRPAESTSPKRTKKVSLACLALYFASRLVGK